MEGPTWECCVCPALTEVFCGSTDMSKATDMVLESGGEKHFGLRPHYLSSLHTLRATHIIALYLNFLSAK